jgi:hypothetical protein
MFVARDSSLQIDAPMFVKVLVAGVSGRPVMGHSGEGRLLLGHGPAMVCGDGTACRFEDNRGGCQAVMGPVPSSRSGSAQ